MRKNIRRAIAVVLAAGMTMLTACGTKDNTATQNESQDVTAQPQVTTSSPVQTQVQTSTTGKFSYTTPEISIESQTVPESEAQTFADGLKLGWNLGNTFDCYSDSPVDDEMSLETMWCGVETTKDMMKTLKDAGFNAIRIPVSWHNHVSGDDYTISDEWIARVKEVVDYCIDNDMYVILNIHHDNSTDFYYPSSDYLEQSEKYVKSIWSQLAAYFADYDDHLIFESLNEPRLVGTSYEWSLSLGNDDCVDAVNCINKLNQDFVDTVRATGGNNATRYLMVPGYDASAGGVTNKYFVVPTDTVQGRLLLSVHAYIPYNFAQEASTETGSVDEFDPDDNNSTKDILGMMKVLYQMYVSKGQPVVIDEFGAIAKGANVQARINYAAYYVACARSYGITCFWWDNNDFSATDNGALGLFNRRLNKIPFIKIVEAMVKYAY
jgi:endoglucanase